MSVCRMLWILTPAWLWPGGGGAHVLEFFGCKHRETPLDYLQPVLMLFSLPYNRGKRALCHSLPLRMSETGKYGCCSHRCVFVMTLDLPL